MDVAFDEEGVARAEKDILRIAEAPCLLPIVEGENKLQLDHCQEGTLGQEERVD